MEKPTMKQRAEVLDYHEMINYIEKKHNIDVRDYAGRDNRRKEHQKITGISVYESPQHYGGNYYAWIDGNHKKVDKKTHDEQWEIHKKNNKAFAEWDKEQGVLPYLDFWHWMTDKHFYEVHNGQTTSLNPSIILKEDNPEWVQEIAQMIQDDFGELADKDGDIMVLIEW
jgi:hypothetical protein